MAISIGRLSGGNTPADGSDPRTFPAIWNATADTLEGGVIPTSLTSPVAGQLLQYNGTNWVNVGQAEAGAIPVFADSTARSSAIPSPSEGMVTYREDANRVEVYDGSAFGAIGGILQVVSTTKTDTFSASVSAGNYVDITGLSVSITPSSASSKILVFANLSGANDQGTQFVSSFAMRRDSTLINVGDAAGSRSPISSQQMSSSSGIANHTHLSFVDSPSTTSSTTYKIQFAGVSNTGVTRTHYLNRTASDSDSLEFGRMASSITVMEVAV